ncbi:MAG: metallophosphoesterase [Actinomycetota bacterium]|nr:metallophosphoesterase [Actinomycetota bacterium]
MRLGLISDSHDNMPMIKKAVDLFNKEEVDLVLHGGDLISPITADHFRPLKKKMVAVFGNNDGEKLYLVKRFEGIADFFEDYVELESDGARIALMHQPKFLDSLITAAKYDLVVYGHTHQVDIRKDKVLVVNPGESCGWISGRATVAIVDTASMHIDLVEL